MKRERNLQEDEKEADDVNSHGGKTVKTEMNGAEESERSGDESIQEPADLSDNRIILDDDQNARDAEDNPKPREVDHISNVRLPEDYPVSIPSGRSENPPRSEDLNLHKEGRDENPEMDEAGQREITHKSDQESIQEHGNNEGESCKDLIENTSADDDNKNNDSNLHCVADLDKEDRDENPEMNGAGQRETHESVGESIQEPRKDQGDANSDSDNSKSHIIISLLQHFLDDDEDHEVLINEEISKIIMEIYMVIEILLRTFERCFEVHDRIIEGRVILLGPLQIEQLFMPSHLWCIRQIYGEHGLTLVDSIRNFPTLALPVIMRGLKQIYEQCCQFRSENRNCRIYFCLDL